MVVTEFARAMAVLTAAINIRMPQEQAEVYFSLLKDLPASALEIAINRVLLEHKISTIPTIAEIRSLAVEAMAPAAIDAGGALWLVRQAIKEFGYPRPKEAIESLPPLVARAARAIGWEAICDSDNPEALRAHFFRVYEQVAAVEKRERLLPAELQRRIGEQRKLSQAPAIVAKVAKSFAIEDR